MSSVIDVQDFEVTQSRSTRLGGGAMGAVFRATLRGEPVAAKTFHALSNPMMYGLDSAEQLGGIVRQAKVELSALSALGGHAHIVGFRGVVYDACLGIEVPKFICMELCDGGSLKDRVYGSGSGTRMSLAEISSIGRQIANGLAFLHAKEFVHRDIKPANIMLTATGVVKIGDLGLSTVVRTIGTVTTGAMTVCGTPLYAAPEITAGRDYGWHVDIYSFGLVICELVLGEEPPIVQDLRDAFVARAASSHEELADAVRSATRAAWERRPMASALEVQLDTFATPRVKLRIAVVADGGSTRPLEVEATVTVLDLRRRIAEMLGDFKIAAEAESRVRLIFEGAILADASATVDELELASGSVLQVVITPVPQLHPSYPSPAPPPQQHRSLTPPPPEPSAPPQARSQDSTAATSAAFQRERVAAEAKEKAVEAIEEQACALAAAAIEEEAAAQFAEQNAVLQEQSTAQRHAEGAAAVETQLARAAAPLRSPPRLLEIRGRNYGMRAVCMGQYSLHHYQGDLGHSATYVYRRDEPPRRFLFRGGENFWCVSSDQTSVGGSLMSDRASSTIEGVLVGGTTQWKYRDAMGGGFTVDPHIVVVDVDFEVEQKKAAAAKVAWIAARPVREAEMNMARAKARQKSAEAVRAAAAAEHARRQNTVGSPEWQKRVGWEKTEGDRAWADADFKAELARRQQVEGSEEWEVVAAAMAAEVEAFWTMDKTDMMWVTEIVVPYGATEIPNNAFYKCGRLVSVVLPVTVRRIGDRAFYKCTSLTSIVIPDSVTNIGGNAFAYCSSLASIVVPDSVTTIGDMAFQECASLATASIPSGVTLGACGGAIFLLSPTTVTRRG